MIWEYAYWVFFPEKFQWFQQKLEEGTESRKNEFFEGVDMIIFIEQEERVNKEISGWTYFERQINYFKVGRNIFF